MASPPKSPSESSAKPAGEEPLSAAAPQNLDDALKAEGLAPASAAVDLDDDEDDEELVVFTASEAAGAFATVYRFTLPLLRNYKKGLAIIGFGLVVETLFNVIMPLSLKFLIDDAFNEEDLQTLYYILGILAVAGIVTSIVAIWYEIWDARTASALVADVRARLFEHVQNLPSAFFARTKRGEVLSRFSVDMAAYESSVRQFANGALLPFMELIAGIGLMLWLNWQLAVVALLIFPITLIGPRIITPKAVQANYEQKVNEAAILGVVQENVAAQAVVKAFGLQRRAFGWFSLRNHAARLSMVRAIFLSTMVERTVTISVLLLHLVVLAIGAYLATTGQISIGTFVTFESAFWEISYNIAHLMHFIPVTIQAAAATRHMQELLDEPPRGADRPGAPVMPRIVNDITFDRVSFTYEGSDQPVIDSLSLKIPVGRSIAVVGPSGSGKSTLLNLILRLYDADQGPCHDRRRRHQPRNAGFAAREYGGGVPGEHAVQHVDPRKHPARQGWRHRR
jgi:ATP-binding cassette subfamily B protein